MKLSLHVNFSNVLISSDSLNSNKGVTLLLGKKYNLSANIPSREIIKSIDFEKMRVTRIEKESGEIWRLVKVGDSLVK